MVIFRELLLCFTQPFRSLYSSVENRLHYIILASMLYFKIMMRGWLKENITKRVSLELGFHI